jgi:hypothetical protein
MCRPTFRCTISVCTIDEKPYGGIPHAIWVDQDKQLISHHIQRIAQDLKIELKDGKPNHPEDHGDPQERGVEERLFGTIKTRLWSTVLGYVHSNTKDRNPNARAELTLSELAEKFRSFVDEYHHKEHSETKKTPLVFWAEHCHATGADPRDLDILLLVAETRILNKPSINYGNRRYWHEDFAKIPVGSKVEIRAQPDYMRPDEIEVFYEKRWICSAFAHDSAKGRAVTGKQVIQAQRQQMKRIKTTIKVKKAVLFNADLEIESQGPPNVQEQPVEHLSASNQQSQENQNESMAKQIPQVASSHMQSKKRTLSSSPPSPKQRKSAWGKVLAATKRQQQQQEERSSE